jgi:hypothetical protein
MSDGEIVKLLMKIRTAYPNSYKHLDKLADEQMTGKIDEIKEVWLECLHDIDFADAEYALIEFIKTDRSGFAPSIGQLRGIIEDGIKKRELNAFFTRLVQKSMHFLPEK